MENYAAVMTGLGSIELQQRDVPELGDREVLVDVHAVGVCGSDAAYYTVGYIGGYQVDGPIVLGHEASGQVRSIGNAVTRVTAGDRVAIEPGKPCRQCRECMEGRYHLCPKFEFLATPPYDGALLQQLVIDERQLFVMPDSMSFEEGALLEPLSVGLWGCHRAKMKPGDRVLITGSGPVGLLASEAAWALGASSVTIVDPRPERLTLAARWGHGTAESAQTLSADFDVLLECSGAPDALAGGLTRLRENGRAAMIGMPKRPVELPLSQLNPKELTISLVNRYAHTWPKAMALVASGRVRTDGLVTHHYPLAQTAAALMATRDVPDAIKAVIHPQQIEDLTR